MQRSTRRENVILCSLGSLDPWGLRSSLFCVIWQLCFLSCHFILRPKTSCNAGPKIHRLKKSPQKTCCDWFGGVLPTEEEGTHWAKGGQHCRSTHCRNILKQDTIIVHIDHFKEGDDDGDDEYHGDEIGKNVWRKGEEEAENKKQREWKSGGCLNLWLQCAECFVWKHI